MLWLLIPAVIFFLFACGYLAACAGAGRWLGLREWWDGGCPTTGICSVDGCRGKCHRAKGRHDA